MGKLRNARESARTLFIEGEKLMHAYFELGMHKDGRYFFTARDATGGLVVESAYYLTRRSALEGILCIVQACEGGRAVCYDSTLHTWRQRWP